MLNVAMCILISLASLTAFAEASQSQDEIISEANNLLISMLNSHEGTIQISFKQLDSRLKLSQCENKLEAFLPEGSKLVGHTRVGVRCNGITPCKLYLQARVHILNKVLVSNRYISRGETVTRDDVILVSRDIATLSRGYYTDLSNINGKVLKQPLKKNSIITPGILKNPKLVHRGESVIILTKNNNIEIRANGTAMMDGSAGELIKVKNVSSQRVIEGRVSATGIVNIPM